MLLIFGFVIVFGSIVTGFTMDGGHLAVLIQINEWVIIGGAGFGSLLVGNKPSTVLRIATESLALMKPNPFNRTAFTELLQVLYDVFYAARKDGLVGIESHVENPEESELFKKYPSFHGNHHAVSFLSDTMKVLLTGAVDDHHLSDILDLDLDRHHDESMTVARSLQTMADSMPGFGIVAAVLGVIVTMGKIGGDPAAVGESVAAALVGTFLGVLLAYGVVGPMSTALEGRAAAEERYMATIRTALLSFSRGDPPITSVEFARRNIEPGMRPSFSELEDITRRRGRSESS